MIKDSNFSEISENSLDGSDLERSMRKNNGRSRGGARNRGRKVYYFDSNDEMFCGSEVSYSEDEEETKTPEKTNVKAGDSGTNSGSRRVPYHKGGKHYQKVFL